MSRSRRVISYFLIWHVTAIALGSVPPPERIPPVDPVRHPTGDRLAAIVTPVLDRAAAGVALAPPVIWDAARPVLLTARFYLKLLGLGQQWNMFWIPPRQDQYVRIRYFVGSDESAGRPTWVARELIFPAHRDDETRIVRSYWDKHRDKAIFTALSGFLEKRGPSVVRRDTGWRELPEDLVPIIRYFRSRFERTHLAPGEHVLRTEFWFGVADIPNRGSRKTQEAVDERLRTLRLYYDGPVEERLNVPSYPVYHASEREADILWVLEYFETDD